MKASELIELLAELKAQHGDLEIVVEWDGRSHPLNVEFTKKEDGSIGQQEDEFHIF